METLLTVAEAAERLGCSRRLIYTQIRKGHLEARRLGGSALWRISAEALERFQHDATTTDWIGKWLAVAPPLTDAQRSKLVELLRPAREFLRA